MALIINTNIASLNAQRNLDASQRSLNLSLQRLSTGLRINSSKDDAAGLAISENMTAQYRGLNIAIRNANDALSLSQIAEGAMASETDAIQRIRELAIQAANGSNGGTERNMLNTEVQQMIAEVDRIATQTEFNGNKILSTTGGFAASFQVGANVNQTVGMTINSMTTNDLGVSSNYQAITSENAATFSARLRVQYANALSSATLNGSGLTDVAANTVASAKVASVNNSTAGVTAFLYGNSLVGTANTADLAANNATANGDIVINGVSISASASNTVASVITAINAKTSETGVTANATAGGTLVLFNTTGAAITLQVNSANAATVTGFTNGSTNTAAANTNGAIVLSADKGTASVATNNSTTAGALEGSTADAAIALSSLSLAAIKVTTVADANMAILAVDRSLSIINTTRATLGAIQSRVESTISALNLSSENMAAARSRIRDADFAMETASLTRSQILQQSGISVLSQANSAPQAALALLQQ